MYEYGKSSPADFEKAIDHYSLAANQGLAEARIALGLSYLQVRTTTKLYTYMESIDCLLSVAEAGNATAQTLVGYIYYMCGPVSHPKLNQERVRELLQSASKQGNNLAKAILLWSDGEIDNAVVFLESAPCMKDPFARSLVLKYLLLSQKKFSKEKMTELKALSEQGNPVCLSLLSSLQLKDGDYKKAVATLQALEDKGDKKVLTDLGIAYAGGYGVPQNDAKAREYFQRAESSPLVEDCLEYFKADGRGGFTKQKSPGYKYSTDKKRLEKTLEGKGWSL